MYNLYKNIIQNAIIHKCSDIHLEWNGKKGYLFYRKEGNIIPIKSVVIDRLDLFNYICFKANLDIIKTNEMSTGIIEYESNKTIYFLRVSLISNQSEKSIVIRLINNSIKIKLSKLCLFKHSYALLNKITKLNSGLVLICGKTGSGKTTTLYALLEEIIKNKKRIITLENPVERNIQDITQIDLSKKNIDYKSAFEQILRHDPDVIIVGEIRSSQELDQVLQVSLSGHLVISTMHALNAKYVINKLLSLNIETNDIEAILRYVIYQKLYYTKDKPYIVLEYLDNIQIKHLLHNKSIKYLTIQQQVQNLIEREVIYEGK